MVITYGGLEFFKVQSGGQTLVFNPVSKKSKEKIAPPRFKTDIAVISLNHSDFNGTDNLTGAFVVDGPGEYEIQEVFIRGFKSSSGYGDKINTIYKVEMEGIVIGFLGALSDKNVDEKVLSALEDCEILFVPIGGKEVLSASEAYKISVKISPNVIIPMHYDSKGALDKFLKEEGAGNISPIDKLTTKKNLLVAKNSEIIVLSSSNA